MVCITAAVLLASAVLLRELNCTVTLNRTISGQCSTRTTSGCPGLPYRPPPLPPAAFHSIFFFTHHRTHTKRYKRHSFVHRGSTLSSTLTAQARTRAWACDIRIAHCRCVGSQVRGLPVGMRTRPGHHVRNLLPNHPPTTTSFGLPKTRRYCWPSDDAQRYPLGAVLTIYYARADTCTIR